MTIFLTGASRGIGLELATQLRAAGHHVIATVRDRAASGPLVEAGVRAIQLDVTDFAAVDAIAERLDDAPVDVLINNAGVSSTSKTIAECTAPELARVINVNSIAPLMLARALLPNLRASQRRCVMNVSSQLASITNHKGGSSYGYRASKCALNMLTVCLAKELAPEGFTCVAVHPGWVRTDMGGQAAPLLPAQSASFLIERMNSLTPGLSGKFLNYDGTELPW